MIDYQVVADGVAVLTWNLKDRPVNVMNDESLNLFSDLIEKALSDSGVKGIVVASAKRDFVTGADLVSFLSDRRPEVIYEKGRVTQSILRRLETGGKPVCAALAGSALGGGMEIALACHRRIVADKSSIRLGFPEVTLGLLPGAGGTQRLPRLLGVRVAIPYLMEGRLLTAEQALKIGMVDERVPEAEVLNRAVAWVSAQAGPVSQPWDMKGFKLPGGVLDPVETYQVFAIETAKITARTQNNLPAPRHILSAVFEGSTTDLETGLKAELRHFVSCVCSVESQNIIRTNFFGVTDAAKLKHRPTGVPEIKIETLGIAGEGDDVMAIIAAAVAAGLKVSWLQPQGSQPRSDWGDSVTPSTRPEDLHRCAYVIRTASDDKGSSLSAMAFTWRGQQAYTSGQVHIRWVPHSSRLVEVVRDEAAPVESVAHAMDFVRRLGKVPLLVKPVQGTYVERVDGAYRTAIQQMLNEGITSALINNAAKQAGMAEVPVSQETGTSHLLRTTPSQWKQARETVRELKHRLLWVQTEEAMRCLHDGVVATPLDADIGAFLGCGFPLHYGGPMGLVNTVGADRFLSIRQSLKIGQPLDERSEKNLKTMAESKCGFYAD